MGRRGCSDYSNLDLDLKSRYITTEELMNALAASLVSGDRSQSIASKSFLERAPWYVVCIQLLFGTRFSSPPK